MKHFRQWGVVYILLILFTGFLIAQYIFSIPQIEKEGISVFWAAVFENHQSEMAQLVIQATLLLGAKHLLFKVDAKDQERTEAKINYLLEQHGKDPKDFDNVGQ